MKILMSLAARGYWWYLPLKVGKAILAIPFFLLWMPVLFAASLLIVVWTCGRLLLWDMPKEIGAEACDFWRRNKWFRGFSRSYYDSLLHYKPAPVPMKPEDV